MQLSNHFTIQDFAQPAHAGFPATPYPAEWVEERLMPLVGVLEALRVELRGAAILVTSGYRSPEFNEALRRSGQPVARNSQHSLGRAADVVVRGLSPTTVYSAALRLHRQGRVRIGGLGLYSEWVHVDTRPGAITGWIG